MVTDEPGVAQISVCDGTTLSVVNATCCCDSTFIVVVVLTGCVDAFWYVAVAVAVTVYDVLGWALNGIVYCTLNVTDGHGEAEHAGADCVCVMLVP